MLSVEEVSFGYGKEQVLNLVELDADDNRVVGLIGPNGSGKTTLLKMLYAALEPDHGRVRIDDQLVDHLRPIELARRVAVVPQEIATELPLTAADMVLLGRAPHRSMFQSYTRSDHRKAASALHRVSARQLATRSFTTLSGGEKQRVMIARALAQEADHLLLDEPTNHLDIRYQHEILSLVRNLGITTVIVLHDLNLAARYCDQVVLLNAGQIITTGTPEQVLRPDVLQPIYGVHIDRLQQPDCIQLIFRPDASEAVAPATS